MRFAGAAPAAVRWRTEHYRYSTNHQVVVDADASGHPGPGTGLVTPHRRRKGEDLPDWKQAHDTSHKQVRARVEHVFARMKTWKILCHCRLKGDGVHHAMLGIARMHNLALAR